MPLYATANGTIIYGSTIGSTIADHYGEGYLGQKIATVTMRLTGVRILPHFLRDAAATTLARLSPQAARLILPVLVHSDFRSAERPYIHAIGIDAGLDYAAAAARLKRKRK